jgi:hypothetical protein
MGIGPPDYQVPTQPPIVWEHSEEDQCGGSKRRNPPLAQPLLVLRPKRLELLTQVVGEVVLVDLGAEHVEVAEIRYKVHAVASLVAEGDVREAR